MGVSNPRRSVVRVLCVVLALSLPAADLRAQVDAGLCSQDDRFEPNDSREQATRLTSVGTYDNLVLCNWDLFLLVVPAGYGLRVTAQADQPDASYGLMLGTDEPSQIDRADPVGGAATVVLPRTETDFPVYLYVDHYSNRPDVSYQLVVELVRADNDRCETAAPLSPGSSVAGDTRFAAADYWFRAGPESCAGAPLTGRDVVYAVTVPAGAVLTAQLRSTASLGLYLLEDCATRCCAAGSSAATGGDQSISVTNPSGTAQDLFLVVDEMATSTRYPEGQFLLELLATPTAAPDGGSADASSLGACVPDIGPCGSLGYVGECVGNTARYCWGEHTVFTEDCTAQGATCGLVDCTDEGTCAGYKCVHGQGTVCQSMWSFAYCDPAQGLACVEGVCSPSPACDPDSYVDSCAGDVLSTCNGRVQQEDCAALWGGPSCGLSTRGSMDCVLALYQPCTMCWYPCAAGGYFNGAYCVPDDILDGVLRPDSASADAGVQGDGAAADRAAVTEGGIVVDTGDGHDAARADHGLEDGERSEDGGSVADGSPTDTMSLDLGQGDAAIAVDASDMDRPGASDHPTAWDVAAADARSSERGPVDAAIAPGDVGQPEDGALVNLDVAVNGHARDAGSPGAAQVPSDCQCRGSDRAPPWGTAGLALLALVCRRRTGTRPRPRAARS